MREVILISSIILSGIIIFILFKTMKNETYFKNEINKLNKQVNQLNSSLLIQDSIKEKELLDNKLNETNSYSELKPQSNIQEEYNNYVKENFNNEDIPNDLKDKINNIYDVKLGNSNLDLNNEPLISEDFKKEYQNNLDNTTEELNLDNATEELNLDNTTEELNLDNATEELNLDNATEELNLDNTTEELNLDNTTEELNLFKTINIDSKNKFNDILGGISMMSVSMDDSNNNLINNFINNAINKSNECSNYEINEDTQRNQDNINQDNINQDNINQDNINQDIHNNNDSVLFNISNNEDTINQDNINEDTQHNQDNINQDIHNNNNPVLFNISNNQSSIKDYSKYSLGEFEKLTLKDLQDIARQNRLKIKGKKNELIERVKAHYNFNANLV